ncbi:putative ribonuclease H-like domain-containing protein, partial [Tanacetum coccineum]
MFETPAEATPVGTSVGIWELEAPPGGILESTITAALANASRASKSTSCSHPSSWSESLTTTFLFLVLSFTSIALTFLTNFPTTSLNSFLLSLSSVFNEFTFCTRVETTDDTSVSVIRSSAPSEVTQEASTNPAGTQDANSDSECDEQVIIVPSYPSHNIQEAEPKDTSGDEVDDSPLDSAEEIFRQELARLKGQEQRATSDAKDAEELQKRASTKTIPTSSIPVPFGDTTISTGGVPVPTGSPTDSFFDDKPTTRFPSPSDLGNNETSPDIFSSSSYDDEFSVDLNNLESIVEEEMQQFKFQNVWVLVDLPEGKYAIGTKWILKNKRDARGIVVRNKARLVAQGHRQEEGIDYDEMDVKSAYISLNLRDLWILNIPRRSTSYRRGTIDKTLFFKKHKSDIILVPVYVDDIIFGSTKKAWCDEFEALMKGGFEMSAMGELTFFLGLQVQQRHDGIFISQYKYVQEILKKFDLECVRTATTPYEVPKPKSKNEPDSPVNVHLYRSMIGSLMYLTASRPDIMFAVSACSRNQVTPTTSNLEVVYKGQPRLGLWYPRESPFVLEAYSDNDYAGANKDRKSTTSGCQFLGRRLISWQCKKQTIVATSSTEAE